MVAAVCGGMVFLIPQKGLNSLKSVDVDLTDLSSIPSYMHVTSNRRDPGWLFQGGGFRFSCRSSSVA